MSFRRVQNSKDQWVSYCVTHEAVIGATRLPREVFGRDDQLEDFLRSGSFEHAPAQKPLLMSDMTGDSFLALEQLVNGFFDFQDAYPALQKERYGRYKRHA